LLEQIEREREKLRRIQVQRREQRRRDEERAKEAAAEAAARAARARHRHPPNQPQAPAGLGDKGRHRTEGMVARTDSHGDSHPPPVPGHMPPHTAEAQGEEIWRRRVSAAKALRRRHYAKVCRRPHIWVLSRPPKGVESCCSNACYVP